MLDPAWILSLMLRAERAPERSPWRASFEATAAAIARAAEERPLFAGADGAAKTAAVIVSVAWFESNFNPSAEGDCTKGGRVVACSVGGATPHSFCALQVHESNLKTLGVTREQVTRSIDVCVDAGLRLMHVSFAVCRAQPLERRLDHYAAGGDGCRQPPRDEGGHRIRKALALFAALPPPASTRVDAP